MIINKGENGLTVATIFSLSLGSSAYLAADAVQQGSMSLSEFVLVNAYVIQLTRPLEMLGFAFRDIVQGVVFIERMAELLTMERPTDLADNRASVSFDRKELAFENVSLAYDPNRRVLCNISFVVPSGKTLAIVGASGSGKSSILRLLLRLLDPDKGQISLDGVPLSNIPVAALRDAIAVVPQDTVLFNESIAYNIGFGRQGSKTSSRLPESRIYTTSFYACRRVMTRSSGNVDSDCPVARSNELPSRAQLSDNRSCLSSTRRRRLWIR